MCGYVRFGWTNVVISNWITYELDASVMGSPVHERGTCRGFTGSTLGSLREFMRPKDTVT
jgi:hypothetical protein